MKKFKEPSQSQVFHCKSEEIETQLKWSPLMAIIKSIEWMNYNWRNLKILTLISYIFSGNSWFELNDKF